MHRVGKSTETENGSVVARGLGEAERAVTANGCEVSFWGDEKSQEPDRGDGCTTS